jgi:hypothetical protein
METLFGSNSLITIVAIVLVIAVVVSLIGKAFKILFGLIPLWLVILAVVWWLSRGG